MEIKYMLKKLISNRASKERVTQKGLYGNFYHRWRRPTSKVFNFCREPGSGFRGRNLRENTFIYTFKNTLEF